MAATPTGRLLPVLLIALVVAAAVGILGSYLMPHQPHSLAGDGTAADAIRTSTTPKPGP